MGALERVSEREREGEGRREKERDKGECKSVRQSETVYVILYNRCVWRPACLWRLLITFHWVGYKRGQCTSTSCRLVQSKGQKYHYSYVKHLGDIPSSNYFKI